jgi:hypothetical protein
MKLLYTPPWPDEDAYEPEIEAEQPLYHCEGTRVLAAFILVSVMCSAMLVYFVL